MTQKSASSRQQGPHVREMKRRQHCHVASCRTVRPPCTWMPMLCGVTSVTAIDLICERTQCTDECRGRTRRHRDIDNTRFPSLNLCSVMPIFYTITQTKHVVCAACPRADACSAWLRGPSWPLGRTPPGSAEPKPGVKRAASMAAPCMTASSESTAVSGAKPK